MGALCQDPCTMLSMTKTPLASLFSQTINQSTSPRGPPLGLMSMDSILFHGKLSLQTLLPLSTYRITSMKGWESIREHLQGF